MLSRDDPHNFRRSVDAPDLGSFVCSSWRPNLKRIGSVLFHDLADPDHTWLTAREHSGSCQMSAETVVPPDSCHRNASNHLWDTALGTSPPSNSSAGTSICDGRAPSPLCPLALTVDGAWCRRSPASQAGALNRAPNQLFAGPSRVMVIASTQHHLHPGHHRRRQDRPQGRRPQLIPTPAGPRL